MSLKNEGTSPLIGGHFFDRGARFILKLKNNRGTRWNTGKIFNGVSFFLGDFFFWRRFVIPKKGLRGGAAGGDFIWPVKNIFHFLKNFRFGKKLKKGEGFL